MDLLENENTRLLISALLSLESEEECRNFIRDIMTSREILSIGQRLAVANLLRRGGTYAEVAEKTGASSATIVRVNQCLRYGSGGYRSVLSKLGTARGGEEAR